MGEVEDQQRERQGQLSFINVTVRFFPEVMAFIQEAEKGVADSIYENDFM